MISNEGAFYFSPSFRAWKDHFRFDYLHRSLLREIWSLRSTSPHPINVGGLTRILKEGEALLSVRRLVRETGIPRTTVQRALSTFVRRGLLRRMEKHAIDGIIFYIPHPMEIPELTAIREYVLGQQGSASSLSNLGTFSSPTRSKRATPGHLSGQGVSSLTPRASKEKNTRNASGGPGRGPDEENVIQGFSEDAVRKPPLTRSAPKKGAGSAPSAPGNAGLDGPLDARNGPSGPLGSKRSASPSQSNLDRSSGASTLGDAQSYESGPETADEGVAPDFRQRFSEVHKILRDSAKGEVNAPRN
jgi:hypothetical protein